MALLTSEKQGDILIVMLTEDRLDAAMAENFKEEISQFVNTGHTRIVFDMTDIKFMDSSGLGALISALKRVTQKGDLVLCNLETMISGVFRLTKMEKVFKIFESRKEALASLS